MDREFLENLRVGEQSLPTEVVESILQAHEEALQAQHQKAQTQHQEELNTLRFDAALKEAVSASRGRNLTAITALLDLDALKQSDDPASAALQAVGKLKQEHGYLFFTDSTQPPYAQGTGMGSREHTEPDSLAGALRQRFAR